MKTPLLLSLAFAMAFGVTLRAQTTKPKPPKNPPATVSKIAYGEHERHVLDFWRAPSDKPTPVLIYIHGGGWVRGDKKEVPYVQKYLDAGISVVSINYRFTWQAQLAGVKPPVSWPLRDAARAVQFVRSKAAEWNLDKTRVAASGKSAGACSSLWLAFHDDMADPKAADPVARESTRLWCAAVNIAQTTLDPQQMIEWTPNSRYGGHAFGFMDPNDLKTRDTRFAEFLAHREELLPWIKAYSPYALATADDPSVYLFYTDPPALGKSPRDPTHTSNFGVKLKEKLDPLGVECELVHPCATDVKHERIEDYVINKLGTNTPVPKSNRTTRRSSLRQADILAAMEKSADWQLATEVNPIHKPTGWVMGAFYAGLMATADTSKSPRFREAMIKIGETNKWKLGKRVYHADDHCVAQAYIELHLSEKNTRPDKIAPTRERFDYILNNQKTSDTLYFDKKRRGNGDRWSWCDALFMAPPAWIGLWKATGDARYLDFMLSEWSATSELLYDKEEHLFYRDSRFFPPRLEANGKKIFWSRGNGWVLAGLARVMNYLPKDHPARPRFERQFKEIAAKVVTCQQADGFWRASLLDPESYPNKESSGTGFFVYGLAWGINNGLLDATTYEAPVMKGWAALMSCQQADGKITGIQQIGSSPTAHSDDNSEPYGVGAFLLAGSEMYKLVDKK
ncbi:rhamnogalacturonyl hydrolase YesR/acetyl esterase/lipase [Ereboglobus sp. PH5-10]|uniref:glycoside hydrolase family 88 protein n=1 Tax=Ereboglobus sp. PH5-10 TaxID=2940629 RepID=UPI002404DA54|nr:glycoside hydrolase family 88 protein [Ereboglobus sp. PH5-10]MDF9827913.1 rhamnogalacturonyl hydrolase YesR/acetyl esterase/lipase [Ereboglobus sp. PH5-10]